MIVIQNFINGEFFSSDQNLDDINPANGQIIASIPNSSRKEVDLAVQAADSSRESWSALSSEGPNRIHIPIPEANKLSPTIIQFWLPLADRKESESNSFSEDSR